MSEPTNGNYEKVGPTAWGVAWHRTFSDIQYAKEIFEELDRIVKPTDAAQIAYMDSARQSKIAPQIEARYKLIDKMIAANPTGQILELAAGLVGRGLAMTQADPSLTYVELDLPEMARNKRVLLQNLAAQNGIKWPGNLYVEDGNALDQDSVMAATRHFAPKPVTVVHEGLLRYLSFDEKRKVADNIRALLEKFGGAWITSDITLKRLLKTEQKEEREDNRKRILLFSGIDVNANSFDNEETATKFFAESGFSVERHSFMEVFDDLVSPPKIDLPRDRVADLLKDPVVYVMRPI
ncbi:MAG: class I SAM-dependent methyltransferase [Patescibacteria group bacterium]